MEDDLKDAFKEHFHCDAEYIVRCPGRVNLIGEHIDYSGYGVLPMAIDAATFVLASKRTDDIISFFSPNPVFGPHDHKLSEEWIGVKKPQWFHYFLCGWKGMIEHLNIASKGMNILIAGTVPVSAGLSSSSSIVCASALMTLILHTDQTFEIMSKAELAELCARVERYIGTEGGGMDQAIEILAQKGSALKIDFNPLKCEKVSLPSGALFAVLHCGATLNKAATSHYNERVVECRIAAQITAKKNGLDDWKAVRTLGQLAAALHKTASEMLSVVNSALHPRAYTRPSILAELELSDSEFKKLSLSANTQQMEEFKLLQRARHVYSEAARVVHFRDACVKGDVSKMGELMKESHESCRDEYECSCVELDQTVEKCLSSGALGARLTGAGWGGCVVALFEHQQTDLDVLFWSEPAGGIQAAKCSS